MRWSLGQIVEGRCHLALVGEAASIDEAVALSFVLKPDVVILDDSAAGEDAWQCAAHLRACYPDLGVVLVSCDGSDEALFRAIDVGASAFVGRSAPVADVIAAVRGATTVPTSFTAPALGAVMRLRVDVADRLARRDRGRGRTMLLQDR